jgi:hypothetical protein
MGKSAGRRLSSCRSFSMEVDVFDVFERRDASEMFETVADTDVLLDWRDTSETGERFETAADAGVALVDWHSEMADNFCVKKVLKRAFKGTHSWGTWCLT